MEQFSNRCKKSKVKLLFKTEFDVLKRPCDSVHHWGRGWLYLVIQIFPILQLYILLEAGSFAHEVSLNCVGKQQAAVSLSSLAPKFWLFGLKVLSLEINRMALFQLMTPKSGVKKQDHGEASHSRAGDGGSLQCVTLWCASPTSLHILDPASIIPFEQTTLPSQQHG